MKREIRHIKRLSNKKTQQKIAKESKEKEKKSGEAGTLKDCPLERKKGHNKRMSWTAKRGGGGRKKKITAVYLE